jgi:hypothetical protein
MEDNQLPTEEVIFPTESPLDHDCCSSKLGFGVGASLITTKNSTARNNTQVWALLGKGQDYWKPKGCFSLTWGIFCSHYLIFS